MAGDVAALATNLWRLRKDVEAFRGLYEEEVTNTRVALEDLRRKVGAQRFQQSVRIASGASGCAARPSLDNSSRAPSEGISCGSEAEGFSATMLAQSYLMPRIEALEASFRDVHRRLQDPPALTRESASAESATASRQLQLERLAERLSDRAEKSDAAVGQLTRELERHGRRYGQVQTEQDAARAALHRHAEELREEMRVLAAAPQLQREGPGLTNSALLARLDTVEETLNMLHSSDAAVELEVARLKDAQQDRALETVSLRGRLESIVGESDQQLAKLAADAAALRLRLEGVELGQQRNARSSEDAPKEAAAAEADRARHAVAVIAARLSAIEITMDSAPKAVAVLAARVSGIEMTMDSAPKDVPGRMQALERSAAEWPKLAFSARLAALEAEARLPPSAASPLAGRPGPAAARGLGAFARLSQKLVGGGASPTATELMSTASVDEGRARDGEGVLALRSNSDDVAELRSALSENCSGLARLARELAQVREEHMTAITGVGDLTEFVAKAAATSVQRAERRLAQEQQARRADFEVEARRFVQDALSSALAADAVMRKDKAHAHVPGDLDPLSTSMVARPADAFAFGIEVASRIDTMGAELRRELAAEVASVMLRVRALEEPRYRERSENNREQGDRERLEYQRQRGNARGEQQSGESLNNSASGSRNNSYSASGCSSLNATAASVPLVRQSLLNPRSHMSPQPPNDRAVWTEPSDATSSLKFFLTGRASSGSVGRYVDEPAAPAASNTRSLITSGAAAAQADAAAAPCRTHSPQTPLRLGTSCSGPLTLLDGGSGSSSVPASLKDKLHKLIHSVHSVLQDSSGQAEADALTPFQGGRVTPGSRSPLPPPWRESRDLAFGSLLGNASASVGDVHQVMRQSSVNGANGSAHAYPTAFRDATEGASGSGAAPRSLPSAPHSLLHSVVAPALASNKLRGQGQHQRALPSQRVSSYGSPGSPGMQAYRR